MKSIYSSVLGLLVVLFATTFAPQATAYVNTTRSDALAYCESGIEWEQQNMPGDWTFSGRCIEGPYTGAYPDYLGCYQLWGHNDIPDEGVYGTDSEIVDSCYGVDDDPAGKNVGPGGGCDGGEGGCPVGAANSGATAAGDPVNTATGNKYLEETDYGNDPWLRFRRFYNSNPATTSSTVGVRWSHSFNRRLDRVALYNGTSSITVHRPTGLRELFHKSGTSGWTASSDNPDTLTESVDGQGIVTGYTLWIAALRHKETYAADGRLLTIQDSTGQTATLTYSDGSTAKAIAPQPNLLISVIAPNGRVLAFAYDGSSRIHQMTLPDGNVFTYDYDHPGNLIAVTFPDGKKRQYVYNESTLTVVGSTPPDAMTGIIDENGTRIDTTSYDAIGRATMTTSAGGAGRVSIVYNSNGSSDVTYPLGGVSHQVYAKIQDLVRVGTLDKPCGECGLPYASRTYDANSYPATNTDFNGNVVSYTYDANGLLTQRIDAKGSSDQRTTDTIWNTTLRTPLVRTMKDKNGTIVSKQGWAYNARGQETATCSIDPVAAPSYTCSALDAAPTGVRRTTSTYCDAIDGTTCPIVGLLLSTDGPRSDVQDVTNYSYYLFTDESGCSAIGGSCHRMGDLQSITDGMGLVTTYLSYDKVGRVTRIKSPNGVLTDLTYTTRGWLASKTIRANTSGVASSADSATTITYDPIGTIHSTMDADGVTTTYTYDGAHRLTDVTDAAGSRVHYTLDAAGNRTGEQVLSSTNAVARTLGRTFNSLGQLIALTDGLNRTVLSAGFADSYDANGNLVHANDGLGVQQKRVFDGLDRLVSTLKDYQGNNPATSNGQSVITFDALNRVTGFSDPDGLSTMYDIDALGNVTGVHSPDSGNTVRTFDVSGNRTGSVDATNVGHTSTFDANNRLFTTTYADTALNIQYKYDEADAVTGCTGEFGKGHLTRVIEGNSGIVWCYDNRGNVVRKQQTIGADTRSTTYAWTAGNRLSSVTTPNETRIAYIRSTLGQITAVQASPSDGTTTTVVSGVTYSPFGSVSSYTLGDGQTVTLTYDANGAWTDVGSTAFSLHVKRDAMGNIIALGDAPGVSTPTEMYSYDPLSRLTEIDAPNGSAIEAYAYDKTGDRLSKSAPGLLTGSYTYAAGTHHLIGVGTTTRQVDARGNTTAYTFASGTYNFGYNQRNRLTTVQYNGVTLGSYVLNALGQRIQKTTDGVSTRFDYDESSHLLSESSGTTSRDYVWLDGLPVGLVDQTGATTAINFVHADGLGSPRVVTNAMGVALWEWDYASNSYGEKAPVSSTGYVLNLRFPGQYYDKEAGLAYNINRHYEAASGRYITSDPTGLAAGSSSYGYGSARPLNVSDPSGLQVYVPPEAFEENLPEITQEIEQLDREAQGGPPPGAEPYVPPPDPSEWGPQGECKSPDVAPPRPQMSPGTTPDFIVTSNGQAFAVPRGAQGPTTIPNGNGYEYNGGSGGTGLDPRVDTLRMMDPVTSGRHQYPDGYGVYQNSQGQGVDPTTGQTVPNNSPVRHISR